MFSADDMLANGQTHRSTGSKQALPNTYEVSDLNWRWQMLFYEQPLKAQMTIAMLCENMSSI